MKFRQHHIKRQLKEEKFQSAVPENQQLVNRMANLAQANQHAEALNLFREIKKKFNSKTLNKRQFYL